MNAGQLNEPIQIYEMNVVINDYGERKDSWILKYSTRAQVVYDGGNRNDNNNEIQYSYTKTFKVRSYVPVFETDKVRWQGKDYRILTIDRRRTTNDILIRAELINE